MKHMTPKLLRFSALLTFVGAVGFGLPAQAQPKSLFGLTIVADVSGDAQNMTARSAQRLVRGIKEQLGDSWAQVDLSLVAFGNGLDTRVDRLGRVKPGQIKELLDGYEPEASAPDEPVLLALHSTVRRLKEYPAGQMIIVLAGGDLRNSGPDDSSLDRPKVKFLNNTRVMLIKATPEGGRDLRTLGEGLERRAESVTVLRFGKDDRARKRAVNQINQALEDYVQNAVRSGAIPEILGAPANAGSD
ncbi:hypothetical protein [Aliiroseovarius sp. S253]|uniref:hypothetical protein n=1 Tax=Aliiroseovarius sp. S253 TaxID=3415133 RepID=UPI003C7EB91F